MTIRRQSTGAKQDRNPRRKGRGDKCGPGTEPRPDCGLEGQNGPQPTARPSGEKVVYRAVSELQPHPLSLAIYGEDSIGDIRDSIAREGILTPLLVKPDGTIISGHRRYRAALELGMATVPAIEVTYEDPASEEIAVIEANRQRVKSFSQGMREGEELERIEREKARQRQATSGPGLRGGRSLSQGFGEGVRTEDEVARALELGSGETYRQSKLVWNAAKEEQPKAVEALRLLDEGKITRNKAYSIVRNRQDSEPPDNSWRKVIYRPIPRFCEPGQKYTLLSGDPSRPLVDLVCGDACSRQDLAKAMSGRKAQLVHIDPPYGVSHDGGKGWDSLKEDGLMSLLSGALVEAHWASDDSSGLWLWYATSRARIVLAALTESGWRECNHVIWVKDQFSGAFFGRFKAQNEPLYFASKIGKSPRWFGPSDEGDTWCHEKPRPHPYHPTLKPLTLVMRAIEDASSAGDLVLDSFVGSGTTLVAAARLGRRAVGLELSPEYCDLAIVNFLKDNPGGFVLTEGMMSATGECLAVVLACILAMVNKPMDPEEVRRLEKKATDKFERAESKVRAWLRRCEHEGVLSLTS